MKPDYIIWDFNGTIINDLSLSISAINTVLKRRELPIITSEQQYRNAFRFPIIKYYEELGMDFAKEPYKIPADEWVALYNAGLDKIPLTNGIRGVLSKFKDLKIPQLILSASEVTMLTQQLDSYGLTSFFDKIIGCDNVYGAGKVDIAKKWAEDSGISFSSSVYIGDTDHDFETAKALGCRCILYCGGHMDRARLEATGVPVIDKIEDIFTYMN